MAIIDLVIIGLSLGFVVICWINSRDGDAVTTTSISRRSETKLPGIDDLPIMERIAKNEETEIPIASTTAIASDVTVVEEIPSNPDSDFQRPPDEIPEFDDMNADESKKAKIECPNCNSVILVEEKGTMQTITCEACAFSGDLEV